MDLSIIPRGTAWFGRLGRSNQWSFFPNFQRRRVLDAHSRRKIASILSPEDHSRGGRQAIKAERGIALLQQA